VCSAKSAPGETSGRFGRFLVMRARRRPLRLTVATSVLIAVIATLVVIVARGPTRFFEAGAVQSGASCTVRYCLDTDEAPNSHFWPNTYR
jgi:hypothetical protein